MTEDDDDACERAFETYDTVLLGLTPYNVENHYKTVIRVCYAAADTYDEFKAAALQEIARRTINPDEEWVFSVAEPDSETVFLEQRTSSNGMFVKRVRRDDAMRWLTDWDEKRISRDDEMTWLAKKDQANNSGQ